MRPAALIVLAETCCLRTGPQGPSGGRLMRGGRWRVSETRSGELLRTNDGPSAPPAIIGNGLTSWDDPRESSLGLDGDNIGTTFPVVSSGKLIILKCAQEHMSKNDQRT